MKRQKKRKIILAIVISLVVICGCSHHDDPALEKVSQKETDTVEEQAGMEILPEKIQEEAPEEIPGVSSEDIVTEPEIVEVDWSEYFQDLNGAAVIYDTSKEQYTIYDKELAVTRRSPCSTFKIISSVIALEKGIIEADNSVRTWSGEVFWNEKWNQDIDFSEAFRASCVWYFREVIDEIGEDIMQEELEKLLYGNCDISDWEGRLNTNNNNRALTGFWIESSLKISPKEQTEVMERIFGSDTDYSEETRNRLKQVMLVSEQDGSDTAIYGKTGMGKQHGIVADAWFTGFAETPEGNLYFCVYLGQSDAMEVSSSIAKDIAVRIVSDYYHKI